MKTAPISSGGQVSIPADIRHRWGVRRVILVDQGDSIVLRPLPDDPIAAARGSLAGSGLTTDEVRAMLREEEQLAEERKYGR